MGNENDDLIYKQFGVRLKKLRKKNNKTQLELSKEIGLSQTAIAQYENGSRRLPLNVLKKIC